jgi:hypothetical protein
MTDTASNGGRKMVTGIFSDGASVERAYEAATCFGYDKGDINVVMSDETRKRYFSEDRPIDTDLARKAAEGGELGGPKGGRISILIPILAAVGTTVALSESVLWSHARSPQQSPAPGPPASRQG